METSFKNFLEKLRQMREVLKNSFFSYHKEFEDIEIRGEENFCDDIFEALLLLKSKDETSFKYVQKIVLIVQGSQTILNFGVGGAVLMLNAAEILGNSKTWIAGLLVYEGYRVKLNEENKGKVSSEEAWQEQYETLKKIGADYEELKHLSDFINKIGDKT